MSRIDDLIRDLCPDGVEYKPLRDLVRIKNGRDFKHLKQGDIPVYGSGGIISYVNERTSKGPSVLIPRKGSLNKLYFVEGPFWNVDTIFCTEIGDQLEPKYFYYYLQTLHLEKMNQAGGVPSLTQRTLNELRIPTPPILIQQEIARTLDQLKQLEAELEAELEARRQQYTYYRKLLIKNASQDAPLVRLRDLGTWHGGITPPKKRSDFWDSPDIHWLTPKDMSTEAVVSTVDHVSSKALTKTSLKYLPKNCIAFVFRSNILRRKLPIAIVHPRVTLNQDMRALVAHKDISANYVAEVCLAQQNFLRSHFVRTDGSMAAVDSKALFNHKIPVPPLKTQEQVSNQLAAFRTIATDLTSGLPAEIEARRKHYEYYRDRLLTFPEKN